MNYLIRNEVLVSYKNTQSLIQKMIEKDVIKPGDGGKVYAIFKYLYTKTARDKTVNFNLRMIIEGCGYKTRGGKDGMNNQFKNILEYLDRHNFLGSNNYNFDTIGLNDNLIISSSNILDISKNSDYKNFVVLESDEEEMIRGVEGVDNNTLEAYFLVIKSRMNNNKGELQVSYASIELMAANIGISTRTAQEYNEILEELDLIVIDNAGSYSKSVDGKVKYVQAANTYALKSNPNVNTDLELSKKAHTSKMIEYGYKPHGKKGRTAKACTIAEKTTKPLESDKLLMIDLEDILDSFEK